MSKLINLAGQKFGRLYVLRYAGRTKSNNALWLCKCDCGNEVTVRSLSLRNGDTKSCGCWRSEYWRNNKTTHGKSETKIARIWYGIKERCNCATFPAYSDYGGRGIAICEEWKNDFQVFYDYISRLPHFGEDGYSLDRIDNDGNYEPGNVRWATRKEQANNRRKRRCHKRSGKRGGAA